MCLYQGEDFMLRCNMHTVCLSVAMYCAITEEYIIMRKVLQSQLIAHLLGFYCAYVNDPSLSEPHMNVLYAILTKRNGNSKLSHKQ